MKQIKTNYGAVAQRIELYKTLRGLSMSKYCLGCEEKKSNVIAAKVIIIIQHDDKEVRNEEIAFDVCDDCTEEGMEAIDTIIAEAKEAIAEARKNVAEAEAEN